MFSKGEFLEWEGLKGRGLKGGFRSVFNDLKWIVMVVMKFVMVVMKFVMVVMVGDAGLSLQPLQISLQPLQISLQLLQISLQLLRSITIHQKCSQIPR